jgi:hypothetical protein
LENFPFCPADAAIVAIILNEVTISIIVYPPFFLQARCSRDDLLLLFGLFLIYIKYLKLLTIENTVLIFQFYK